MTTDSDDLSRGDNPPAPAAVPADAHGQAALLLVESLIHGLCDNAALSIGNAVEIVERAVSVQLDQAEAADGAAPSMWQSHTLLSSILASLQTDSDDGGATAPGLQ